MVQKTSRKRTLQLAAPPVLVEAVKDAADRELLTISEYIRRTLIAAAGRRHSSGKVRRFIGQAA